jgi:hypothetical protein
LLALRQRNGELAQVATASGITGAEMAIRATSLLIARLAEDQPKVSDFLAEAEMDDPELATFCLQVAGQLSDIGITAEQISEVLGGTSNLYLEQAIHRGNPELETDTEAGLASACVPLHQLVLEIQFCAGASEDASRRILAGIQRTMRERTEGGKPLFLPPLGVISPIDPEQDRYRLRFRDPAADHYASFLL